jgi:hypothetical protein
MPDSFTPFHRAAGPGDCGPALKPGESRWPTMLVAALLLATTTAAALMAATGTHAPIPALWKQDAPSLFTKAPDSAEYRELLF